MRTDYVVAGVTYGHYASHIAEEIQTIKGVKSVSVDWESSQIVIESNERIPFNAIVKAVARAGGYAVKET